MSDALLGVRITEVFRQKTAATVQNASRLKLNDDPDSTPLNHKRVVWGSGWKAGFCRLESTGVFVWGRG